MQGPVICLVSRLRERDRGVATVNQAELYVHHVVDCVHGRTDRGQPSGRRTLSPRSSTMREPANYGKIAQDHHSSRRASIAGPQGFDGGMTKAQRRGWLHGDRRSKRYDVSDRSNNSEAGRCQAKYQKLAATDQGANSKVNSGKRKSPVAEDHSAAECYHPAMPITEPNATTMATSLR